MDICILIPATLPQVTTKVVDMFLLRPATLPHIIPADMLVEVDLGIKIPAAHTLTIREQSLMLKGEVDIVLRLDNIPPITKVTVVYF